MTRHEKLVASFRHWVIAFGLVVVASPAAAQWTRVLDLPATDVVSVWANRDTIVAGMRTVVYVSTDAGASWHPSSQPVAGVTGIRAARIRNGKLYAGTSGQGAFISDNLGQTWRPFNEGLVGGIFNSQLDIADFAVRGDSLYAATLGAGVYVRKLTGASTWSHFGEEFEPNQASNVESVTLGGTRLLANAGANGTVFFRDPGDAEWTRSWLDNVGLRPGLQARSAAFTGTGWVVGAGRGVFRSVQGQEPWTFLDLNLGSVLFSALTTRGHRLFAAFDIVNFAVIEQSGDDGATWELLDVLPNAFVYKLAMIGTDLYAGRVDGLWRRSTATVSVPGDGETIGLRFALAGPQPVANDVRFHFELPEAGIASIQIFDVAGRRAAVPVQQTFSAGSHEVSWNARELSPGIYQARLTARDRQEVVRIVRVR